MLLAMKELANRLNNIHTITTKIKFQRNQHNQDRLIIWLEANKELHVKCEVVYTDAIYKTIPTPGHSTRKNCS